MRTCLLILLLTTFISCGKKLNEISSHKGSSAFLSENALIIPHNESGSAIRIKLLNKIVEETYEEHNSDFTHVLFEAIQDTATDLGFLSDE